MSTFGIYVITNTKNSRVYIGSTTNLKKRWWDHRGRLRRGQHRNPHLQAAWNKYNESTFEFGILEYLNGPEELHLAEQFWMDIYREEGIGLYNFGLAARHPMLGRAASEETRCRLSEAARGNTNVRGHKLTKEHRRKIGRANKGKHHSEEARRKIGKANKGRAMSKETRRKMGEAKSGKNHPNWGKHLSEKTRCKIGKAHAKPYPAFVHRETGEIISAGVNLHALCRKRGLHSGAMGWVRTGKLKHHKGWILLKE